MANPPAVNSGSVMEATRGAAREAVVEEVVVQRMTEIMASQPDVPDRVYTRPQAC